MFGYVYKTTNTINDKVYIGKKKGSFNRDYLGSGIILKHAIKKYGKENFITSILQECKTLEELNETEIQYIDQLNPDYNLAAGGDGGDTLLNCSSEYKKKILDKRITGLKRRYKELSFEKRLEWNKAISESKKGNPNGRKGYKHRKESIDQIKESNRETYKQKMMNEEYAERRSENCSKGRKNKAAPNRRKICYDDTVYDAISIAAKELGVSRQTIFKWLKNGKAKYVK